MLMFLLQIVTFTEGRLPSNCNFKEIWNFVQGKLTYLSNTPRLYLLEALLRGGQQYFSFPGAFRLLQQGEFTDLW